MDFNSLIFYDLECFKYNTLAVLMDINGAEIGHYWNDDPDGFKPIAGIIKDRVLAGYNNFSYDDVMLYAMISGAPQEYLKALNDAIIHDETPSQDAKNGKLINSIDMIQQIVSDKERNPSLKQIEANLGRSIIETEISFDIDRPLTEDERAATLKYCRYDVLNTIEVFKQRQLDPDGDYFASKAQIIDMLGNYGAWKWNTTTIIANILTKGHQGVRWSNYRLPECVLNAKETPAEVWDYWRSIEKAIVNGTEKQKDDKKGVSVSALGCKFEFGKGGLHGDPGNGRYKDVKLLDVASMYPSILINLLALGDEPTAVYSGIKAERIKAKHAGDKAKDKALKLILNSTYGLLKNRYSTLYNPAASMSVCIYGQVALYALCTRLYNAGYTLINANTDGIAFIDPFEIGDDYRKIWSEWEKEFNLTLELDEFTTWVQKDVNNYVAVLTDGKIKAKGGQVSKYLKNEYFKNNDARICHIALVEYLINGTAPGDTIAAHTDEPALYQYILHATSKYTSVIDEDGNEYNKNNRIFAAKPEYAGKTLYKVKPDGSKSKFANTPEYMFTFNDDLERLTDFKTKVDLQHYEDIVLNQIASWTA